jgi:tetratricopeptide (TPR) repeat protein
LKSPKDRNLLLTRSHIHFYRHNFLEALCDIDAVIEIERASSGEEEPNATDLLHRGRCHACLSMFKEAINDFSRVIELDDELFDAYFFRGKCCYLIGDTS